MKFDGLTIKIANSDRPKPEVEQFKMKNPFETLSNYFSPHKKVFENIDNKINELKNLYSGNTDISQEQRMNDLQQIVSYMEEIAMHSGKPGYEELMKKMIQLEGIIDIPSFEKRKQI